jgi:hypothetical protein
MHWIAALAQSGIRDLGLCSAQIESLSRRHAEIPCSSLTQKRVVSICTMVIKECDASGSNKKAIEWWVRAKDRTHSELWLRFCTTLSATFS